MIFSAFRLEFWQRSRLNAMRPAVGIALAYLMSGGADAASSPHGPFDPNSIETYEITVEPDVLRWLRLNALKESYVPARLRYRGEDWGNVAMRFKGAISTLRLR